MADEENVVKTIVTKREDTVPASVTATTPTRTPANVRVVAMTAVAQILVRAIRTYIMSLSGLLTAGGIGADRGVLPDAFGPLLWTCAGMALAPTVMSVLGNAAELMMRLDESLPQLRA